MKYDKQTVIATVTEHFLEHHRPITYVGLAERLGVSPSTASKWAERAWGDFVYTKVDTDSNLRAGTKIAMEPSTRYLAKLLVEERKRATVLARPLHIPNE